jgi:hypothetical protein
MSPATFCDHHRRVFWNVTLLVQLKLPSLLEYVRHRFNYCSVNDDPYSDCGCCQVCLQRLEFIVSQDTWLMQNEVRKYVRRKILPCILATPPHGIDFIDVCGRREGKFPFVNK